MNERDWVISEFVSQVQDFVVCFSKNFSKMNTNKNETSFFGLELQPALINNKTHELK